MSDFNAYFSHKWSIDYLPIHTALWSRMASHCRFLLDQPEPAGGVARPYFISRLESLMRRADVMVCVIPVQGESDFSTSSAANDYKFADCSPYILFELRLAERLGIPRLVLYDRRSSFRPTPSTNPRVIQVCRDFGELGELLAAGKEDADLSTAIDDWLRTVNRSRCPKNWTVPTRSGTLFGPGTVLSAQEELLQRAMQSSGFDRPDRIQADWTDAELINVLRSLGLLVVDVSDPFALPLMHVAQALMVPTIRVMRAEFELPSLLWGHPAGYQLDLVKWGRDVDDSSLLQQLSDRGRAVARGVKPVVGLEQGTALLHQRTYLDPGHSVFISHNEKPGDRKLVELLVDEFNRRGIHYWEYVIENRAGADWQQRMQAGLQDASHMVALVAPRYEKSDGCMEEWNFAMSKRIPLLPFLRISHDGSKVQDCTREQTDGSCPCASGTSDCGSSRERAPRDRSSCHVGWCPLM